MMPLMNRVMAEGRPEGLPATNKSPHKLKVFIVEDELLNVALYKSLLAVLSDRFQVFEFTDGDEAWTELSKTDPDLLITDILHPGLDGWELLKLLAAEKVTYPILLISGDRQSEEVYKSCYPGLNLSTLGKPIDFKIFYRLVSALLTKPADSVGTAEPHRADSDSSGPVRLQ